jgi:ketosteroid isomerase-like protein
MILPVMLVVGVACQPPTTEMTAEQRAAIRDTVEQIMAQLVEAARALDGVPVRAAYAQNPVSVINGIIIEDFDARFEMTKQFLGSLRALDGSYDNLYMEVLAPDAVVATRNDHLNWTDTSGTTGEWHSAWTGVFRRIDGEWKIVYAHESTPHEPL